MTYELLALENEHEKRAIVSGLRRLRSNLAAMKRRDRAKGWTVAEGAIDVNELRLTMVDKMLARFTNTPLNLE